jgi:hypothetical protein
MVTNLKQKGAIACGYDDELCQILFSQPVAEYDISNPRPEFIVPSPAINNRIANYRQAVEE